MEEKDKGSRKGKGGEGGMLNCKTSKRLKNMYSVLLKQHFYILPHP